MRLKKRFLKDAEQAKKLLDLSGIDHDGLLTGIQPEKLLLLAIIDRAIADVWDKAPNLEGVIKADFWMETTAGEESSNIPFSFRWCCEQISDAPEDLIKLFQKYSAEKHKRTVLRLVPEDKTKKGKDVYS